MMKPPIENMVCESGFRYETAHRWYEKAGLDFPSLFVSTAVTFSPTGEDGLKANEPLAAAIAAEILPALEREPADAIGAYDFAKFHQPYEVAARVDWRRCISQLFWLHCATGVAVADALHVDRAIYDRLDVALGDYYLPENVDQKRQFYTDLARHYIDSCNELAVSANPDTTMLLGAYTDKALGCIAEKKVAAAMGVRILKLYQHNAGEMSFAGVPVFPDSSSAEEIVVATDNFIITDLRDP